ncbi:MAG: hypothetical protein LBH97_02555 [Treponema sp.]|jgi:hypothetical protein|nr:hypothetical protein [Treponema sp.]
MRKTRFACLLILCAVLAFNSCSKTERIADGIPDSKTEYLAGEFSGLNGTWLADEVYQTVLEKPEGDRKIIPIVYSWGEGKMIWETTFNIDITDTPPYFFAPGAGGFQITEVMRIEPDSIKVYAYRANTPNLRWFVEAVFHIIDKDTMRIECKNFGNGEVVLWHRMSGPGGYYRWRVLE